MELGHKERNGKENSSNAFLILHICLNTLKVKNPVAGNPMQCPEAFICCIDYVLYYFNFRFLCQHKCLRGKESYIKGKDNARETRGENAGISLDSNFQESSHGYSSSENCAGIKIAEVTGKIFEKVGESYYKNYF